MKTICTFVLALLYLHTGPGTVAMAAMLNGTVERVVPPYLLVKTADSYEVIRMVNGCVLGNAETPGHLRPGRDRVTVEWSAEKNRVRLATAVTRLPLNTIYPALDTPTSQVASWLSPEAGANRRTMIDVRPRVAWEEGHVVGSLSAPYLSEPSRFDPFPAKKTEKYMVYDASNQSSAAQQAIQHALSAGYTDVLLYSGGIDEWVARGNPLAITAAGAKRRLDRGESLLVLDSRDNAAWLVGHIPGALHLPAAMFHADFLQIRNRNYPFPVLIVGESLKDEGELFSRGSWGRGYKAPVYLLEGGHAAWAQAGYLQVAGGRAGSPEELIPPEEIGPAEFRELWNRHGADPGKLILNVRDEEELPRKGQLTIPFEELEQRLNELPRNREIIVYCYTGTRAGIAYHLLKNNGFSARYVNSTVRVDKNGELQD